MLIYTNVKTTAAWQQYKKERNNCTKIIKKPIVNYEIAIVTDSKNNNKAIYKYVNSKLKTREPVSNLLKSDGSLSPQLLTWRKLQS